ncbi:MAG: hypothetical protein V3R66_06460, partial [Rhodospirillales bacterium]
MDDPEILANAQNATCRITATADSFRRLKGAVVSMAPARRFALSAVLGGAAATAFAPTNFWPLLVPSFVGLMWLIDAARGPRAAFAAGWWFGFGHFAAGLYWIGLAFMTFPDRFGWMAPFAVIGLAAGLAVFPA